MLIDLSDLTVCDANGLHVLVEFANQCHRVGTSVRLTNVAANLHNIFETTGSTSALEFRDRRQRPPQEYLDGRNQASTSTDQQAVVTSRAHRDRSLDALHVLELHAGSAAPGREHEWLAGIRAAITTLEYALGQQQGNAAPDESLLSTVEREAPRLHRHVQELRQRYRAIHDEISSLRQQLDATEQTDTIDVSDIRQKLERLANELRYQRARETDIVYEAHAVDLGEGD